MNRFDWLILISALTWYVPGQSVQHHEHRCGQGAVYRETARRGGTAAAARTARAPLRTRTGARRRGTRRPDRTHSALAPRRLSPCLNTKYVICIHTLDLVTHNNLWTTKIWTAGCCLLTINNSYPSDYAVIMLVDIGRDFNQWSDSDIFRHMDWWWFRLRWSGARRPKRRRIIKLFRGGFRITNIYWIINDNYTGK